MHPRFWKKKKIMFLYLFGRFLYLMKAWECLKNPTSTTEDPKEERAKTGSTKYLTACGKFNCLLLNELGELRSPYSWLAGPVIDR